MAHLRRFMVCALLLAVTCMPAAAGLLDYIQRPEPDYAWSKGGEQAAGTTKVTDIEMTSQKWQGITWTHTIQVFTPAEVRYPDAALLVITGGDPGGRYAQFGAVVATAIGAPVAVLFNIPNQPLFGGLGEDDLIAYTFQKYLDTGDETWPLLLPMTKSAIKAMDALQAFAKQEWRRDLNRFVVTGGSKRGWTTWLTAAADPKRVKGIAPMVIDNLNIPAQMPHQIEVWGKYSDSISEYTERSLQAQLATEAGAKLVRIVDPYCYRDRITMPKLIINGANDQYWVVDALNFYWDDLKGEKHVLYVPNSTHGLEDFGRVVNSLVAFFHSVGGGNPLPGVSWKHGDADGTLTLSIAAEPRPVAARIWAVRSDDLDFRDNRWEFTPMAAQGDAFIGSVPKPANENIALFGEAEFSIDGRTFTLSTQVRVVRKG